MKPIISAFMCTNRTLQRSRADLLQEKFVHIGSAHKCPGEVLSLATTNAHDNLSEIEEYSKMSHGKGDIISAIKEHIDIPDYLESCGYHIRKHGSKGKLTLKEHDSFVYDPARKRFYWNPRDLEGDIVDLYGYLNNCDFDTAIRALRAMLPARTHQASRPSTSAILRPGVTKSAPFSPPKPAPQNLKYVYAYLINTRSISPTVVKWLVKQHYIYADAKRNLCYISPGYGTDRPYVGQKGTWVDSETGKPTHFRCAVEGGNFEGRFSVNMVRADGSPTCVQRVFVCEAAVDLFSIMSFLELNQRDFTQYGYISLECCYESPLNYHLRHHPETKTLYLGQDNDLGGAQSRAACRVLLQQQNWPGRVVDKIPCTPSGDWNDDLRAFCSSAHPSKTTSPVIPSKGGEKR